MKLLVTGATGMLGRAVTRAAEETMHEVVALARSDLDVTDRDAVGERIRAEAPDAIVNCAAWTDVDGAEAEEEAATRVNGLGAGNVAAAATDVRARVLHVSTDYVFDGGKPDPYLERDATAPRSAYGRSKLAGELAVARAGPEHLVVRTAWLFGAGGRNFVETILSLADERDELRVVEDQVGCPTWTGHLAPALVSLAGSDAGGLVHVAGEGPCSWYEFAVAITGAAGLEARVEPCPTSEFPRPAPRPANSALRSERDDAPRLPHWREGLAAYLSERQVERR